MLIARIVGNVVSTVKTPDYNNHTLFITRQCGLDGKVFGPDMISMDAYHVDAGVGDYVLLDQEGGGGRDAANIDHLGPVENVVVAIVDYIQTSHGTLRQFGGENK